MYHRFGQFFIQSPGSVNLESIQFHQVAPSFVASFGVNGLGTGGNTVRHSIEYQLPFVLFISGKLFRYFISCFLFVISVAIRFAAKIVHTWIFFRQIH